MGGGIKQRLEPCPIPGKTNCLTTVAKDNLLVQRPRGKKQGCIFTDKAPTLTQSAWEQNNLIVENACLTARCTEYGKAIRQQYEAHEIQVPRSAISRLEPRTDGKTNTLTTVQKDNLLLEPGTEAEETNPTRIRRFTPKECARLQTIPDWYKWVVSETQQYKMLGNGWTVEVIKHIFSFLPDHFKH